MKVAHVAHVASRNSLFRRYLLVVTVLMGLFSMVTVNAFAAQATLTWDPPVSYADGTPISGQIGYKVHIGTASGSYTQTVDVGNLTSYSHNALADGTNYYFAVSAYDALGTESSRSNEMSKTTAVPPPPAAIYTITAMAGTGCSISPASAAVTAGQSQSFVITPAAGYSIAGVTVDGSSVGAVAGYTFSNVSANHTIAASFAPKTYSITATAGAGGSISPSGTVLLTNGSSKIFSIVPNKIGRAHV